ncbi:protein disulfide reductase, TlpA family [Campylobacter subantarcticus LMG 24377]|uniref:TlpA family protein disulfide reductase n=1 Tax=Campylobacter subantarcticus TaxID=497724 RepID=A0ABW9N687_9BACT|nr:TlpA disulfide reductase family protein [Campylobacter subantarcticus]AJC92992.1 protein disulfide reductase, TlpA family [Campylobacter subantarcticus LMG 24377]EAL3938888.1 TlpA family protein disulfide reductase [Campylobacter lari]MPB99776.1 TlpA family protein disulfide reductase [Campylobacter subantarcticus]
MKIKFFLVIFIVVFFASCSSDKEKSSTENTDNASLTQSENTDFTLKFLDERKMYVKYYEQAFNFDDTAKAKLFVFFTTWCAPCKAQIPHLNNLNKKYQDRFEVIVLFLEENKEQEILTFIEDEKMKFSVAIGESNFAFSKVLNISSVPTMVLFNTKGEKIKEYLGIIPEEMLDIDIQKAIM